MLVLTRTPGHPRRAVIKIGDDIEVTIVEVRGQQVRVGITAPAHVPFMRADVLLLPDDQDFFLAASSENKAHPPEL